MHDAAQSTTPQSTTPQPETPQPETQRPRPPDVVEVAAETFDEFYRREYRSVVGLGFVLSGDRTLAEDLVQEAFTEAHRRWSTVSGYDNTGAWLRRVLVNKATSRRRRLVSEAKALTMLRNRREPAPELAPDTEHVWAAVRRLPRRQSQAIALQYWDDLTVAEIAAVLGCGEQTVKTHLKRAKAALATELGQGDAGPNRTQERS